jgi:hypothetical protein
MLKSLALIVVAILIVGCQERTQNNVDADRILHMAGEEAGQINAPKERLTRQLNIANRQTEHGHAADARNTLAQARETLEHADKNALNEQERLSGWVSLSELGRAADDKAFANGALDKALASLNEITPAQERCKYVLGVEREVRALRGDVPAARLLVTASEWAMELPKESTRRSAYVAYADGLFHCNDYEGARTVLRRDPDAAWRSDALTSLSDWARFRAESSRAIFGRNSTFSAVKLATPAMEAPAGTTAPRETDASFSTPLDFKSNFYRAR